MAEWVAPLHREAALRPAKSLPGKLLAAAPRIAALVAMPEIAAATLAGIQGVGAASDRARQTHAPDGVRTDLGILGTGAFDAAAGRLLPRIGRADAARFIERLPEEVRGPVQDLVARTVLKSAGGATVSGAQTVGDNVIAGGTFDPDRRWSQGVGESLLFGGVAAAPFGTRLNRTEAPPRPRMFAPPVPPQRPGSFKILYAGAHKDLRLPGFEAHHMPSKASSPLPASRGLAILLSKEDHQKTASHGNSREAQEYIRRQRELNDSGDFAGAEDMDIEDIKSKFGRKYELGIDDFIKKSRARGNRK